MAQKQKFLPGEDPDEKGDDKEKPQGGQSFKPKDLKALAKKFLDKATAEQSVNDALKNLRQMSGQ